MSVEIVHAGFDYLKFSIQTDMDDANQSRVWRFEMRLGSKQLRRRFAIYGWDDLDAMIGDAFVEFAEKITYREKTHDRNRSRWPIHEIWQAVQETVAVQLTNMRAGVCGDDVRTVKRAERIRMLEQLQLGLAVSRAATDNIGEDNFQQYLKQNANRLVEISKTHSVPIDERLAKAARKVKFAEV